MIYASVLLNESDQSLLMPYYGKGVPRPTDEPVPVTSGPEEDDQR